MEIQGTLSLKFNKKFGEIDINMELDQDKAAKIHQLIKDDAASSELDIFTKNIRHHIKAKGMVRKMVLREIINILAR